MAYTVTLKKHVAAGNERLSIYEVTSDATSGVVETNLSYVDGYAYAPISMNSAGIKLRANLSAASATANGSVMVDDTTSGDAFILTVFGR